jgi:histidinol-phosphate/aromatic aminotransferase/cobyric acid decarboxylase-like protein
VKRPVDLSMNEMPFLPPENVVQASREGLLKLNRYAGHEDLKNLLITIVAFFVWLLHDQLLGFVAPFHDRLHF